MKHRTNRLGGFFFLAGLIILDPCISADDSSILGSPTETVSTRLLYGESDGISWSDLAVNKRLTPLLTEKNIHIFGVDYHYDKGLLFYSTEEIGIWRLPFNKFGAVGEPEELVRGADGATSLAVDWIRDKLYWITPKNGTVERVDLEGNQRELVINLGEKVKFSNFNNIVIDPYSRFMFLAVDENRFIRTNINGGGLAFAQPKGLKDKRVVSLAIDRDQRRLYVSSRHDHVPYITSCDYDGSYTLDYDLSDAWWHSFLSIDVLGNQLFWVHSGWHERDNAYKANMSSNGTLSWEKEYVAPFSVIDGEQKIWNLKVYHPHIQSFNKKIEVIEGTESNVQESTIESELQPTVYCSNSWRIGYKVSDMLLILSSCIITLHSLLQKMY